MKIYRRVGPRIMIGIIIAAVCILALIQNYSPTPPASMWNFAYDNIEVFVAFIIMFAVIIAAGSISGEFSKGTIKLLLIRPINRSKILLSKYVASLMFSFIMLVLSITLSLVVGGMFFGFEAPSQANVTTMDGSTVENVLPHFTSSIAFVSVDILMMVTIGFMISTIFHNSALAIGVTIFLRFAGPNIVLALQQYDWAKYILFANLNLRQHIGGVPYLEGLTMTFSVITLIVYFFIFIILTWWIFNKKDVAT
ncbi:ABC transporter permease subunit [Salicibibacter cibarius]|uniref:ABC transporter permease subunit n=2 Tax=Salicibibacter cibarius TaxID=2743000 RepID=A0A7T6Z8D7_9BACI|nr:ABC transporter permease subunit [Salicibibacter cibarius]